MPTLTAEAALRVGTTDQPAAGTPFTLPLDWVTSTNAILAKKGAGKSYLAGVIEEELCKRHVQWGCLDPVSAHWGIRGGYEVVIFGGEHADIPIRADMGAEIARAVIEEGFSFILDIKRESKNVQRRLVTDFCNELLLHNRSPLHLFIEECTEFVPQTIRPDQTVAFDAVDRLVRLGRGSGIGITLISQRPAKVNKDVLSQIDTLFVLRMVSPQDRKAVLDWLEDNVSAERAREVVTGLAKLPTGTAWVWSPEGLEFFGQVKIRARETFHAGATPKVGQKPQARLVSVDVSKLRARFAAMAGSRKPDQGARGSLADRNRDAAIETALRKELDAANAERARLMRAVQDQAADLEELKRQLRVAADETKAAAELQRALRHFLGGVPGGPDRKAPGIQLDDLVAEVMKRLPAGGPVMQVTPPEALRKEYQQREVERMLEYLRGLEPRPKDAVLLLESSGQWIGQKALCARLGIPTAGNSYVTFSKQLKDLAAEGVVEFQERQGVRGALRSKLRADLAYYQATEEDVEQVYQHCLAAMAQAEMRAQARRGPAAAAPDAPGE